MPPPAPFVVAAGPIPNGAGDHRYVVGVVVDSLRARVWFHSDDIAVVMAAPCGLRIRFSQLLVHLVGGGPIDIVEEGMGLFGHYFSGVVDLVVFSCHAATSKSSGGADDVASWASFSFSD